MNYLKSSCATFIILLIGLPNGLAQDDNNANWNPKKAAEYLDSRASEWVEWGSSNRGSDSHGNMTSCIACHTGQPYMLARGLLAEPLEEDANPDSLLVVFKGLESRIMEFEDATYYYEFSEEKIKQSKGTEAIQNALISVSIDVQNQQDELSELTSTAFETLWATQISSGSRKGGWDWLDFNLEPWESTDAAFYGATLAATAVGIAPGYNSEQNDDEQNIELLKSYLTSRFAAQNLHNQMAMLSASASMDGILDEDKKNELIETIFGQQKTDGGWSLISLSKKEGSSAPTWNRHDGTEQVDIADGFATGYAVFVLRQAGIESDDERLEQGLKWLESNQNDDGSWHGTSVNKNRSPTTHVGKFMNDAATAYAVLALMYSD